MISLRSPVIRSVAVAALTLPMGISVDAAPKKRSQVDLSEVKEAKKRTKKAKPTKASTRISRNEAFLIATETRLLREIRKAIDYLEKTVRRMPRNSSARLEMRERLVNLRLESAIYYGNQEMRQYNQAWDRWDRGGRKGREPKLNNARSRKEWQTLSSEAQRLLQEFPRSRNADVTMFNMALAKTFLGREKDSARIFSQLIAKYPNSKKAGDAYFALGDYYFDRTDFRNAMNNYRSALRFKQSKMYPYALFKMGWCHYNLGNYAKSMTFWKQTVAESQRNRKAVALKEEALRDLVYAFAELRQVESAISYYRRNGGQKYIGQFLLLLSRTFSDQGKYDQSIKVLKRYQQIAPRDPDVPSTQKEIIALNYELGRFSSLWSELARFPRLYGPKSGWAAANRSNRQVYLTVQKMIKDQIMYYAKVLHKRGQKDNNRRAYLEAMRGYRLFLQNYPDAKEVAEVKYNMADIEYFNKKYRQAGKHYLDIALMGKKKAVVYDVKTNKPKSIHLESSRYMLGAFYDDFEPELKVLLKRKPDFSKPARPISVRAKNFIKACGYYQRWYPQDKKTYRTCDVHIAEIYYRNNNRKQSIRYLWFLAKKYPDQKEGKEAVENLIPLYKKDKAGLRRTAAELLKIPQYSRGKMGEKLRNLVKGLELEEISKLPAGAKQAVAFENFYKKNPRHPEAPKMIYNSAVGFLKAGMIARAINNYSVTFTKHPKSAGSKDALLTVAKLYEKQFEFEKSAVYYARYARLYPKDRSATSASAKSCELQASIESSKAINTCLAFASKDREFAKSMIKRMVRSAFYARNATRLQSLSRVVSSKFRLSDKEKSELNAMIYFGSGGKGSAASSAMSQIQSVYRRSPKSVEGPALRIIGSIAFKRAEPEMARFKAVKLRGGSVEAMLASINAKGNALGRLQSAYDKVLATKDAYWGVAAYYQLGHARELLAEQLEKPPAIRGAPYADVVKQLAPDAQSARKEALRFFRLALDLVPKFNAYNSYAHKAITGLARNSGKRLEFDDIVLLPDFIGGEVPTNVISAVGGAQ